MTLTTPVVKDLLNVAVVAHGHRPAVRDAHGAWTYRELADQVALMATGLRRQGVRPGDRVVAVLPDSRDTVALLYATIRVGAIFVPVDQDTSVYRLRWLISDATPQVVVTDSGRIDVVRALPGAHAVEPRDLTSSGSAGSGPTRSGDPDGGLAGSGQASGDAVALMIYTSGTTAHPRGVVCQGSAVAFAAQSIAQRLAYSSSDIVMTRLPLSFDYGLYQVLLCTLAGAELVLAARGSETTLLSDTAAAEATIVPVVPALANILAQLGRRRPVTTRVRMVTNTGAALAGPLVERLRQVLPETSIVFMYGMTECKRISISDPDDDLRYPGSVGPAIPGTRLFIVDAEGRPLPTGEVGQIVAAGPHVMTGYWNAPEASAQRFCPAPDGLGNALFTGDYGQMVATGRLYFVGRRDEIFKRRGLRTSLPEVEASLLDIPGVEFAAAVITDDGQLVAWVVGDRSERDVCAGVVERLGTAKTPDRVIVLPELPRTGNGKTDKAALRAMLKGA